MNRLRSTAVLVGLLTAAGVAQAQDFKPRFVGKSPCAPELQSEHSDFSLRLDKTQDLTLLYRDLSAVKIVMIIQPSGFPDHCGVIRDIVQITHIAKDFEFRCFDPQMPTDVVIGTSIRKGSNKPVTAIDAWRIDLKNQEFIETPDKVTCTAEGWAGEDDGSDLVDEAKKYAAHHKPGQFASEPAASIKDTLGTPLVPGVVRIKEWAYAGFGFAWICAFIAHYLAGAGPTAFGPLIALVLLVISYLTRPATRQYPVAVTQN